MSDVEPPVTAYVALGANLGDREANIRSAITALNATPGIRVTRTSSLVENPAVGGPEDSPAFFNGVAEVETTLSPEAMLARLLEIERSLGRERREKWSPRPIDLDLLLYGDRVIDTAALQVPHPLMQERRFVLGPLAELAPDVVHPVSELTVCEMLSDLDAGDYDAEVSDGERESGVISRNVRCVGCGYNLRGLPAEHACPECGRPTADSIDPDQFRPFRGGDPFRDHKQHVEAVRNYAEQLGYAPEALLVVNDCMYSLETRRDIADVEGGTDFRADDIIKEFEALVLDMFCGDGPAAAEALSRWGIQGSEDLGRIVFALVDAGWFSASEGDKLEDFKGRFVTTAMFGVLPRPPGGGPAR